MWSFLLTANEFNIPSVLTKADFSQGSTPSYFQKGYKETAFSKIKGILLLYCVKRSTIGPILQRL